MAESIAVVGIGAMGAGAGFKLRLGLKDLRLVLGAADEREVPMPLAGILHDRFLALAAQGQGDKDWTAIGLAVAKEAGVGPPSR
jgi:NAD-binding of NADP-dependent 3-hydroxyisobutyrate dehydrogenase